MSLENLQRFREVVLSESKLQEQLKAARGKSSFINLIVQLGKERGLEINAAEVEQLLQKAIQRIANEPQLILATETQPLDSY